MKPFGDELVPTGKPIQDEEIVSFIILGHVFYYNPIDNCFGPTSKTSQAGLECWLGQVCCCLSKNTNPAKPGLPSPNKKLGSMLI
jgi:hypothetical protein